MFEKKINLHITNTLMGLTYYLNLKVIQNNDGLIEHPPILNKDRLMYKVVYYIILYYIIYIYIYIYIYI